MRDALGHRGGHLSFFGLENAFLQLRYYSLVVIAAYSKSDAAVQYTLSISLCIYMMFFRRKGNVTSSHSITGSAHRCPSTQNDTRLMDFRFPVLVQDNTRVIEHVIAVSGSAI